MEPQDPKSVLVALLGIQSTLQMLQDVITQEITLYNSDRPIPGQSISPLAHQHEQLFLQYQQYVRDLLDLLHQESAS